MKNLPLEFNELSAEDLIWITDHVFGNLFVCNRDGRILYLNQNAAATFGLTRQETLRLNTQEIVGSQIIDRSTTMEALSKKKQVIGNFKNLRTGQEYFAISTPMFDESGEISLVMTYSQEKSLMTTFFDLIERERELTLKYKHAYNYITNSSGKRQMVIGVSQSLKSIYQYATRIAKTDGTVIVTGESGSGKDVLSNYIHTNSFCSEEPFIPVNCSAIPNNLMESEFFGYEKGAFTGAKKEGKPGLFELANRGTLFLDEIGELPLEMQTKLLRALETGEIMRVGGIKPVQTKVRLIVATNRNLKEMVRQKQFREDLYYRLNVIPIHLPPLREHAEDIIPLATYFLEEFNKKYSLQRQFSKDALSTFSAYPWPGNVRELRNVVERLVITSTSDVLSMDSFALSHMMVSLEEAVAPAAAPPKKKSPPDTPAPPYRKLLQQRVIDTLLETGGNKTKAAARLEMSVGKLNRILSLQL